MSSLFTQFVGQMLLQNFYKHLLSYVNTCGVVLAVLMSWDANQSIGWALLHGAVSWFYVAYATESWILVGLCVAAVVYLITRIVEKLGAIKVMFKALSKKEDE